MADEQNRDGRDAELRGQILNVLCNMMRAGLDLEFNDLARRLQPLIETRLAALRTEHEQAMQAMREERDEAIRECSTWAREAGFAKGKLETSEAAGVVDGWRERAEKAEADLAAIRQQK